MYVFQNTCIHVQVEISTLLLTFSLLLGENPIMSSTNNPDMSGYFNVNFIPCLIALLITQSAHREYSFVNDINDIYSSIMSCC